MAKNANKPTHVSKGDTLFEDLGFPPEEAAVMRLKVRLHAELLKVIAKKKLTPKQVERILDMQQPNVSKLIKGDLSRTSSDRLTKYLRLLGQQVNVTVKKAPLLLKRIGHSMKESRGVKSVRRAKAAIFSGYNSHPETSRSSR